MEKDIFGATASASCSFNGGNIGGAGVLGCKMQPVVMQSVHIAEIENAAVTENSHPTRWKGESGLGSTLGLFLNKFTRPKSGCGCGSPIRDEDRLCLPLIFTLESTRINLQIFYAMMDYQASRPAALLGGRNNIDEAELLWIVRFVAKYAEG